MTLRRYERSDAAEDPEQVQKNRIGRTALKTKQNHNYQLKRKKVKTNEQDSTY